MYLHQENDDNKRNLSKTNSKFGIPSNSNISSDENNFLGDAGLINFGKTCFINSIIQCLRFSPLFCQALRESLISIKHSNTTNRKSNMKAVAIELLFLMDSLRNSSPFPRNPIDFLDAISHCTSLVQSPNNCNYNQQQQDAQEFLLVILDILNELFQTPKAQIDIIEAQENEILKEYALNHIQESFTQQKEAIQTLAKLDWLENQKTSLVTDFFSGQMTRGSMCLHCRNITVSNQEIRLIQLDLHPYKKSILKECLKCFTATETMKGDNKKICNSCQYKTEFESQLLFQQLPICLVFQLKRFYSTSNFGLSKIQQEISFPIDDLDMTETLFDYDKKLKVYNYSLYAICCHIGKNIYSGHYIAYSRHIASNEWFEYNDEQVRRISLEEMLDITRTTAYLLFYYYKNTQVEKGEIEKKIEKRRRKYMGIHVAHQN